MFNVFGGERYFCQSKNLLFLLVNKITLNEKKKECEMDVLVVGVVIITDDDDDDERIQQQQKRKWAFPTPINL